MERRIDDNLFSVYHDYDIENYEDHEEGRFIGIFDSKEKAEKIIEEYKKLPGFIDFPDGFCIDKVQVNKKTEFKDGFITIKEIDMDVAPWFVKSEYYKQNFKNKTD